MTCKTIEADSGIFTLGSKSLPLVILPFHLGRNHSHPFFSLHHSGCRTRHRLALLRLRLHRTIHVDPLRQQGRVHHLGSEQRHFFFGR